MIAISSVVGHDFLNGVSSDVIDTAIALDEEFRGLTKRTTEYMYRMGQICAQMKALLPSDNYRLWLQDNKLAYSTMQQWIKVQDEFDVSELQNFVTSAIPIVAALPQEGIEEAKAIAQSGVVDMQAVRELKERHKPSRQGNTFDSVVSAYQSINYDFERTEDNKFKYRAYNSEYNIQFHFRGLDEAMENLGKALNRLTRAVEWGGELSLEFVRQRYAEEAPGIEIKHSGHHLHKFSIEGSGFQRYASTLEACMDALPEAVSFLAPQPTREEHSRLVCVSAKTDQHFTPTEVVEAVLNLFGSIDLDPCSNSKASPNIPAKTHFTVDDDGIEQYWFGNVYENPPYSVPVFDRAGQPVWQRDENGFPKMDRAGNRVQKTRSVIGAWVAKTIEEVQSGRVNQLVLLVKNDPSTDWFQQIWANAQAICLPDHRLRFINESNDGNSATFSSALVYFGADTEGFEAAFAPLGVVLTQWTNRKPKP